MTLSTHKPSSTNTAIFTQTGVTDTAQPKAKAARCRHRSEAPQEKDRIMETNVPSARPNR